MTQAGRRHLKMNLDSYTEEFQTFNSRKIYRGLQIGGYRYWIIEDAVKIRI